MTKITTVEPDIESIARFQSLQAGQYWTSIVEVLEQGIAKNETLLIKSIRWVDNAPHTVVLEPHPLKLGKDIQIELPDGTGGTRKRWFSFTEHKFLTHDFLNQFQFEPDHEQIRGAELRQAQGRLAALERELIEGQSSADAMNKIVEAGLLAMSKSSSESAYAGDGDKATAPAVDCEGDKPAQLVPISNKPSRALVSVATGSLANALSVGVTAQVIADMKGAANHGYEVATIK